MLAQILANKALILAVLLGVSEALAQIPSVKANSVFQAILNALRFIKEKFLPSEAPKA